MNQQPAPTLQTLITQIRACLHPLTLMCLSFLCLSTAVMGQGTPPPGLIHRWSADGNARDSVGGQHGFLENGVTYTTGKFGNAFNLDGVDGRLVIGTTDSVNIGLQPGMTIELWIKPSDITSRTILEWENGSGRRARMELSASAGLSAYLSSDGITLGTRTKGDEIKLNTFQHIAWTSDAVSGTNLLYLDGVLKAYAKYPRVHADTTRQLYFGKADYAGRNFKGLMDEIRFYNRALSPTEILEISRPVPPAILTHPASQSAPLGANVTFNCVATGTSPLSYQWFREGVSLPGATGASLTLTNFQASQIGSYTVAVSNPLGTVASSSAALNIGARIPPSVTTQPISQLVTAGTDVMITVTADGSQPLNYQWRFNGTNLPGAIAASLPLPNVQLNQAGSYSVVIANDVGSVVSSNAVLAVAEEPTAPLITLEPEGQDVYVGEEITLVVEATGSPRPDYLWRRNTLNIPGGTNATLSLGSATTDMAGEYYVIVSNPNGTVLSTNVTLNVNPAPFVLESPRSIDVPVGDSTTLGVQMLGQPPFTYQWRRNGANLTDAGATAASYPIINLQADRAGSYDVVVMNGFGSVTSALANVSLAVPPAITVPLLAQSVPVGGTLTLIVGASGSSPNYLWLFNGQPVQGATNSSLIVPNFQSTNAGNYLVIVANGTPVPASSFTSVTVDRLPLITQHPESLAIILTEPARFAVETLGQPPFTYQWRRNGVDLSGETGTSLTFLAVQRTDSDVFSVHVSNAFGAVDSSNATLVLKQAHHGRKFRTTEF